MCDIVEINIFYLILMNNYNYQNNNIQIISFNKSNNLCSALGRIQGNRLRMEDIYYIDSIECGYVFAIFDGHGKKYVAEYVKNNAKKFTNIVSQYNKKYIKKKNLIEMIKKKFIEIDLTMYNNNIIGGSTCIFLYILKDKYIFINLGDSKGISIENKNLVLSTTIHRPNNPLEKLRIEKNKDTISNDNGIFRINNIISLSRSFGDFVFKMINHKYNGINSSMSIIPDIYIKNFTKIDNIFLIASDGFWDYISLEKTINIIRNNSKLDLNSIVKLLIVEAIKNKSNDNITVILLKYLFN